MEEILKVENLTKKIGKKVILNNISFTVNKGEILGFLGPNGAGKTTAIKCIMGLIKKMSGKIYVCGVDVNKNFEKAAENFGGIIENPEMYGDLTAYTNIKVLSMLYKNITKEKIYEVLELVGLKGHEKEKVKTFSLGMKQRLGLAQALIHNPKLLILDEPTNGLDPIGIKKLRDILKKLAINGTAVLISSHQLAEMNLMCDKVCIINKGKILEIKDLKEIESANEFYFDVDNIEKTKEVLANNKIEYILEKDKLKIKIEKDKVILLSNYLKRFGINTFEIQKATKTLEDIFLEEIKENENNKTDN